VYRVAVGHHGPKPLTRETSYAHRDPFTAAGLHYERLSRRIRAVHRRAEAPLSADDLRVLAREQTALWRVATLVARGGPPEEVFAAVTAEVGKLLPVDVAYLCRCEPDRMGTFVAARGRASKRFPAGSRWPLTVTVTRCAWRKPGTTNWCPADAALSLPARRHSHSLAKLAAIEAARGSFGDAHAAVTRRCGNVIGKRQLEESVVRAAADIPAFYAARIPEPRTPGTLLILSADCKGRGDAPGGATGRHRQGRRPAGEDAHPADRRGETEPEADGRPGHCLRHRPREAPPARRDRPARRPARRPQAAESRGA
jgi:GAF domain-containing protein